MKINGNTVKYADHTIECPACGKDFHPKWSYVEKRWAKYCDRACFLAFIKQRHLDRRMKTCAACGLRYTSGQRGGRRLAASKYCSKACSQAHRVGPLHPRWGGGVYVGRKYRFIKLTRPEARRHTCSARNRGYLLEHIATAERALGRCLKKGEVVHHINYDKLDNRPSNLLICTQKYHAWLHHEMSRRYAVEHFGGR